MTVLRLNSVGHAYLGRTILDRIDLAVRKNEIVALVGPSGCGKSTLAHIAAGLIQPRAGRLEVDYARHAMVFQEPHLLPWATAAENIAFALRLMGTRRREQAARVKSAAALVALEPEDLVKYPAELSGGMKQRVAIARALVIEPDFIIFDEPFTALDVALRRRMQDLVIATCANGDMSGLFITHDLYEAARIADKIAVLDTNGQGVLGERQLSGAPGERNDAFVFRWVQSALSDDPLFGHIHDVDERQIA